MVLIFNAWFDVIVVVEDFIVILDAPLPFFCSVLIFNSFTFILQI